MDSTNNRSTAAAQGRQRARLWFESLISDTEIFDLSGVQAAMLCVRLTNGQDADRATTQVRNLLTHLITDTDRLEQTADDSFSLLLAPQPDLQTTIAQVRSIAEAIETAGIHASTGFAYRRAGESLLDTWARAEAQLDRAAYRSEHSDGLTL